MGNCSGWIIMFLIDSDEYDCKTESGVEGVDFAHQKATEDPLTAINVSTQHRLLDGCYVYPSIQPHTQISGIICCTICSQKWANSRVPQSCVNVEVFTNLCIT